MAFNIQARSYDSMILRVDAPFREKHFFLHANAEILLVALHKFQKDFLLFHYNFTTLARLICLYILYCSLRVSTQQDYLKSVNGTVAHIALSRIWI